MLKTIRAPAVMLARVQANVLTIAPREISTPK